MDDGTALRLPAQQIEGLVLKQLTDLLSDTAKLMQVLGDKELTPNQITTLSSEASALRGRLMSDSLDEQRITLIDLIDRIQISPRQLTLKLRRNALMHNDAEALGEEDKVNPDAKSGKASIITLDYPLQMKRRGVETKLILGAKTLGEPDLDLIKLIATARAWYAGLKSGRYSSQLDIRKEYKLDKADVSRILNLAFLSPKIVSKIIAGDHPAEMTVKSLKQSAAKLPYNWEDQARFLGLTA